MRPPSRRRQRDAFLAELKATGKAVMLGLFAVMVFVIFICAVLVGAGAITMPEWSKNLDQFPDAQRNAYAAGMFTCVIVVFFIFLAAGLIQMRREQYL